MKRIHRVARCATSVLFVVAAGCQSAGVSLAELPAESIAIHYRTPEEARRRAEDWGSAQNGASRRGASVPGGPSNDAVAHTDQLGAYLRDVLGSSHRLHEGHPGRLALLDPRSGDVAVVRSALRGSVPLAWSVDRRHLLFAQPSGNDVQIWELDADGETVRPVTQGPLAHPQGCYASDGRIVAVEVDRRERPGRSWIALSGEGGRDPYTPISAGPNDHSPACAPDGHQVAFIRELASERQEIWIAAIDDAAGARRLTPGRQPTFSPDGEWIVFSGPARKTWQLWRVRPDGSARAPIGRGVRDESTPVVSPDGRMVAYVATETEPRRHLYLRRFDGSGDRILFANGDGQFPVW